MKWLRVLFQLALAVFFLFPLDFASSQEKEAKNILATPNHSEFGVHGGGFLPFGIYGVRSSYTAGGIRVNHHLGSYKTEVGVMYFNMESVSWTNVSYSVRSFLDYDYMKFFLFMGADIHYYKPKPTNVRELPETLEAGGHIGFSPLFEITPDLYFRADFKMNFNPGQSLYAAVGFLYAIPEEAEKNASGQAP